MNYSIVIPLFNEEGSVTSLWEELKQVMEELSPSWEVIFVDDGSTDNSSAVVSKIKAKDKRVISIHFRKNQGKAAALQAGFKVARGEVVITMDADLQDDPSEIPKLVNKLDEGYDLVSGYKRVRHDPIHKTLPSHVFNRMVSKISDVNLHDINSGLKAYRHEVIENLFIYGDLYRFIPIIAHNEGFRVAEVDVNHRPRLYGKSKYGFNRFMRGILDLFTVTFLNRFVKRPLHFFGPIGLLLVAVGLVISAYLTVMHTLGTSISDRPLLNLGILCIISGIQLISTGLIGELITYYAHNVSRPGPSLKIVQPQSESKSRHRQQNGGV